MRAAARKPAKAQMMTFWKNVECTPVLTAATVPYGWTLCLYPRVNCGFGTGVAVFPAMTNPVQAQPSAGDAEQMARLLELELAQKRLVWKHAKQRKKSYRSLAFLFLFLLFAACLLGFFFAFNRVNEERQSRPATATSNR